MLIERTVYVSPILVFVYSIALLCIVLFRIDYSRSVLIHAFLATFVWLYWTAKVRKTSQFLHFSAIDNFDVSTLCHTSNIKVSIIYPPYHCSQIKTGLVVDLHKELSAEQSKFVADCSINNIPVVHSDRVKEMLDGKVQTERLSENAIGTLKPSPFYTAFKRFWESVLITITLPITLPLMLITALVIKIENPGPAIFTQERVGQGGRIFKIYKFRSMSIQTDNAESKFATAEQARITKVGKIIRKVRIDELPQFFNVLKGEMALIGPRPEQDNFVQQFEESIPFYGYRHMVKPGITGWAQTVQGYADDESSTKEKLSHDLYYIKYFSFWLDMNIILKTIKTMATGFGAK